MGFPCTRITVSGPLDKMPFDTSIFVQVQAAGRRATFSQGLITQWVGTGFAEERAYFGTVIEVDAKSRTLKVISTDPSLQ